METVRVIDDIGRMYIPKKFRDELKIKAGNSIRIKLEAGKLILIKCE